MSPIIEVTSNGLSGKDWIAFLEVPDFHIAWGARQVLLSREFAETVTNGVAYRLTIIKATDVQGNEMRRTKHIQEEATRRGYHSPPMECAPLLRKLIPYPEIFAVAGLKRLIVMHKHVRGIVSLGLSPFLLGLSGHSLDVFLDNPDMFQTSEDGFVFLSMPPSDGKDRQE